MKIFLDTNIILDLLLERAGFETCADIFEICESRGYKLSVSVLTMVNVAYVYKKTVGQNMAVVNLKYLSSLLDVLPMDFDMMQSAIMISGRDFEDTFQAVCAGEGACDYIITRNPKDFVIKKGLVKTIKIPDVVTPLEFINRVNTI